MLKEIKFTNNGIRYKSVKENLVNLCDGCVFYDSNRRLDPCTVRELEIGGYRFGLPCADNSCVYEFDGVDGVDGVEEVEQKYTVLEVIDALYAQIGIEGNFENIIKETVEKIKIILRNNADPDYNQYLKLKEKFEPKVKV